ncbi:MAG TPA: hypothetical protein VKX49_01300 [Bryobacteraceae bacterium]|nr:hypothetical protein [Bryobacteraceae bacterium]
MKHRSLCFVCGMAAMIAAAQAQVAPHTAMASAKAVKDTWTPPRTSDGHPDLQGFWANNNATPIERPKQLANRASLTDAEVAAMRKKAQELYNGKGDAAFGDTIFETVWDSLKGGSAGPHKKADDEFDSGTGDYSSEWIVQRVWDNRTALITDPPDGRMPPMTAEGRQRREAMMVAMRRPARGPEDRGLSERCLTYGSPQLTAGYQSYYQVVQTPKSVMLMTEMIHDVRSIPIDGGPHPGSAVQEWLGDSRGHWEGDTLVIDTTNYKPKAFMSISSEKLHVIERLTRTGPELLRYEITIDDPGTWTKPWSLMIPLRTSHEPVYEYACHEGNEGLAGILAGARAEEAAAAKKQ